MELTYPLSFQRGGAELYDGRVFDEKGVDSCVLKENGAIAEQGVTYGKEDQDAMLRDVKRVDWKVSESIW